MVQNVQEWLAGYAADIGTAPPTREELDVLLEPAGVAAHASERPTAPITCWLVGRAGLEPRDALAVAQRLAGDSQGTSASAQRRHACGAGSTVRRLPRPSRRTSGRVRSPQTNGVIERFFGTLKYRLGKRMQTTSGRRVPC
jgi:hypothetical protein